MKSSDNSDDSHEIRVSAFDSNAGVQNPLRLKGPFPTLPSKLVQMEVMSG